MQRHSLDGAKVQADSDEALEIEIDNAPVDANSGARTPTRTALERSAQGGEQEEWRSDGGLRPDGRSPFGRRRCLRKPGTQTGPLKTREGEDQQGKRRGKRHTLTHTHKGKEADGVHAQSAPKPPRTTTPTAYQQKMAKEKTPAHTHTSVHTHTRKKKKETIR